jgi:hypothetical protein
MYSPLAAEPDSHTVLVMNDALLRQLLEKHSTYQASADEATGSTSALSMLQRSLLTTLEMYDLEESTEALAGAAVALDHVLRCLHVANKIASELHEASENELQAALQSVTRGCVAADAALLVELLGYRL